MPSAYRLLNKVEPCLSGLQVEKGVTLRRNWSHLKEWLTLGKVSHGYKSGLHLHKWVTFANMSHRCRNGFTSKNVSLLNKCVKLRKKVTLGKMFHT